VPGLFACTPAPRPVTLLPAAPLPASPPPPPEIQVRTVRVHVPVRQPCKAKVPPRPKYIDEESEAGSGAFEMVDKFRAGIAQRKAREKQLEAALASCGVDVH